MKHFIYLFLVVFAIGILYVAQSNVADEIDMECLAKTETMGNPWSYNIHGRAVGLCQITQPALDEYNLFNIEQYTLLEMFQPEKNIKVAHWYLHFVEKIMLFHFIIPNPDRILISYTWGPGAFQRWYKTGQSTSTLPAEVRRYLGRYHRYLYRKHKEQKNER